MEKWNEIPWNGLLMACYLPKPGPRVTRLLEEERWKFGNIDL